MIGRDSLHGPDKNCARLEDGRHSSYSALFGKIIAHKLGAV